jgi:hypothetical protein
VVKTGKWSFTVFCGFTSCCDRCGGVVGVVVEPILLGGHYHLSASELALQRAYIRRYSHT